MPGPRRHCHRATDLVCRWGRHPRSAPGRTPALQHFITARPVPGLAGEGVGLRLPPGCHVGSAWLIPPAFGQQSPYTVHLVSQNSCSKRITACVRFGHRGSTDGNPAHCRQRKRNANCVRPCGGSHYTTPRLFGYRRAWRSTAGLHVPCRIAACFPGCRSRPGTMISPGSHVLFRALRRSR